MPKLSERSKVIGKGTSYSEKLEKRKVAKNYAGPSNGGNRLNQKKLKDKFKVPGMALTQAQKKKLLKKQRRAAKKTLIGDDSDSAEPEQQSDGAESEEKK